MPPHAAHPCPPSAPPTPILLPNLLNPLPPLPLGPCGPCSELYYDFHPERGTGPEASLGDDSRFIEFYNLVFMELNRGPDGSTTPLAQRNIDTGLGLERMAQILQVCACIIRSAALVVAAACQPLPAELTNQPDDTPWWARAGGAKQL